MKDRQQRLISNVLKVLFFPFTLTYYIWMTKFKFSLKFALSCLVWIFTLAVFPTNILIKDSPPEETEVLGSQQIADNVQSENSEVGIFLVVEVIDGDTIKVEIDGKVETVRMIGIDTPETLHPSKPVECYGEEAAEKTRELLFGKTARLEKDVSEADKYGRLLRYVWVDEIFVNRHLVRQGYASAFSYPPDIKYQEGLNAAQALAREDKLGLWGSDCDCEDGEVDRECIGCQKAMVTHTNWDCSTYTKEVTDGSCETDCQSDTL